MQRQHLQQQYIARFGFFDFDREALRKGFSAVERNRSCPMAPYCKMHATVVHTERVKKHPREDHPLQELDGRLAMPDSGLLRPPLPPGNLGFF